MGESWHEVDSYLLDNRNRTQKWDESEVRGENTGKILATTF